MKAQPSEYSFERLSTEDGLPNKAEHIAQDKAGYLWFGTLDGVFKYDGYQSVAYRNIPGDSSSLDNNTVESILIDSKNDLWVGTPTGLNRYRHHCDCFVRYPLLGSGGPTQVNRIAEDSLHNIWIGTQQNGLFRYERSSGQFTPFLDNPKDPVNLLDDQVRTLMVDNQNQLWIGTGEPFDLAIKGGGLVRLDLTTGKAKRYLHDPANPKTLLDNRVSALLQDREGRIWAGTCQSGLHYYDAEKDAFIRMMPDASHSDKLHAPQGEMGLWSSCPHVRIIHQMRNGEFWVGTFNGGLYHFDPKTNNGTLYRHHPDNPHSLVNDMVWNAFEDRQGRLWVLNLDSRVHKIDPSLHKFKVYAQNSNAPATQPFKDIWGIYEAPSEPGIIWLAASGGGLIRLNIFTDKITRFLHKANDKKSISSNIVWTTYEDRNGVFWVGTEAGLGQLNRQTGEFNHVNLFPGKGAGDANFPVTHIYEDQKGNVWVGTWSGGVVRLGRGASPSKQYNFSKGSLQTYFNSVYAIHEDSEGAIWVGTWKGDLFKYHPAEDRFLSQLNGFGTTFIHEDAKGTFWIGTEGFGLLNFNPRDNKYRLITTTDGLSGNRVAGILEDDEGFLWISTTSGLSKFDPQSGEFLNFDRQDGLPSTEFNIMGAYRGSNGQFYFGGVNGLVSFLPEKVNGNSSAPVVHVKHLQIGGKPYLPDSFTFNDTVEISLKHWQNDLTFEYVGLHFTHPLRNRYRYKLEPYDSTWIEAGTQRTARYTNLNPGKYTFHVIAANSDGYWNTKGASVSIYITPPWWTRWWACLLYIAAGAAIILALYRFQLTKKLAMEEGKRQKELNELKNNFYTNITHEFRTPLTVISGMADELEKHPRKEPQTKLDLIKKNSHNLLSLVNQMLDLSKLQAGKMSSNIQQGDMIVFLKYLIEAHESFAKINNIGLQFYSEEKELLMDFDAKKIEQVLSNLISNAVKFTPEYGKILVVAKKNMIAGNPFLEIKIKDNGIGIPREQLPHIFERFHQANPIHENQGSGIGLALVKELMENMKGKIRVESEVNAGTMFLLQLPISNNAALSELKPKKEIKTSPVAISENIEEPSILDSDLPILLIIEDNPDVTYYLKTTLENDYQVISCRNGKIGVEKALQILPDIIICDVMMPEMDGFEVCGTLKADERTSHIPIILLTAKATSEDKLAGLSNGADAYLVKPFEIAELMVRLENLMEVRRILQKKYSDKLVSSQTTENTQLTKEESFIQKTENIVLDNLENEDFSIHELSRSLLLSRSQAHRKIKTLTGMSTAVYIRHVRLQKAKELLATTDLSISEIAYQVGFKTPVYFSQAFKEAFGESPSATRN